MKNSISDETYFALLEGLLREQEAADLLARINQNPELKAEWEMWQMTVQTPSSAENTFQHKSMLLSITASDDVKGAFWYRVAGVAAILLLGLVSLWMLSDVESLESGNAKIDESGTPKKELSEHGSDIEKEHAAHVPQLNLNKAKDKNAQNINKGNPISSNKVKGYKQDLNGTVNKVNTLVDSANSAAQKTDTIGAIDKVVPNFVSTVVEVQAEMVYGTPVSKRKKQRRKLLSWRNRTKEEIREWVKQPQLGFTHTNGKKKSIELKNSKFKIGIKP